MGQRKPAMVWRPAAPTNYTDASRGRRKVNRIIIHVTQGSWAGSVNWFANPNAAVSAHYVVRSSDGKIAQCVKNQDIAWHAGNWDYNTRSIGIEHEGFVDDPAWFTEEMFRSSAKLVAYLHGQWGIPLDRDHIIGHNEVPGSSHTDPGEWWWWSHYMELVRHYWRT
ncbi:N-acetylmuramoyl-L-alanine amidase [Nocardioides mesophilus]|uniref:N-acetylmuramoyl-L-alanine amidase n=1 Tax=Nocardioides mesophilus TaxID=433659 RepID=A0A7G9RCD0_9ACTN|nr:peptidoglycan recognition family protein [Nocardioides mesophilus]QNN53255.1 N-acetylmuramoyl-L-alanine amidase [Nocardioides mesophilus]